MPKTGNYCYLMVIADQLSGWPEDTPTTKADSAAVTKFLLKEVIPLFGIPERIDSGQGSHFTSQ